MYTLTPSQHDLAVDVKPDPRALIGEGSGEQAAYNTLIVSAILWQIGTRKEDG